MDNIYSLHTSLLHIIKNNIRPKTGRMAIKLDMSKAYNCIEWSYLKVVMKALSFVDR